jgi:preprotein translocase subunit SecF
MNFEPWYNKNYKKLLIIPAIVLALSLIYIGIFYIQNGDIINKDVSLTGGTTITIQTQISAQDLETEISKTLTDFEITTISNNAGAQIQLAIIVGEQNTETLESVLENFLDYELTSDNGVSKETTSASLSEDFYKQLIVAVLIAFFWMAAVVFLIFSTGKKTKFWVIVLNILLGFFMGNFFLTANPVISAIIFIAFAATLVYIYIKNSIPSFAVMLSAFANIIMALAIVDLIGIKISTAGIVAFLMLIGYSVDTDILLTTRMLKKHEETNKALFRAFKTGTTMTITSIIAITAALIVVFPFASVLNQIFTILLIGLGFDLFNTWITNASIIKWYVEESK